MKKYIVFDFDERSITMINLSMIRGRRFLRDLEAREADENSYFQPLGETSIRLKSLQTKMQMKF